MAEGGVFLWLDLRLLQFETRRWSHSFFLSFFMGGQRRRGERGEGGEEGGDRTERKEKALELEGIDWVRRIDKAILAFSHQLMDIVWMHL